MNNADSVYLVAFIFHVCPQAYTTAIRTCMISKMNKVFIISWIFSIAHGSKSQEMENFVDDIIKTWQLRSPTIIGLPEVCIKRPWVLGLPNEADTHEIALHLAKLHQLRKQDGVIFIGSQGHENLLKQILVLAPSMLASNYPVFMPTSYEKEIMLRLDSNIVFYGGNMSSNIKLHDIFAVKGGVPIYQVMGTWNKKDGISLLTHMNRWDRRTDLMKASFVNAVSEYGLNSAFIRDENGTIKGTKGLMQDQLFYVIDNLNLTIKLFDLDVAWNMELLENGSWTGEMGLLQRKEVDVVSAGLGVNLQRSHVIDYPIPTWYEQVTLVAAIPRGTSTNFWVYVTVFGVTQWTIFVALLILLGMGATVINATTINMSWTDTFQSIDSSLAFVYMYTIQKGSHTHAKQLAAKILTFTAAMLTLLFFVHYTTDITAEMTSAPTDIPVKTFEDVIRHKYRVVTNTLYWESILSTAEPGTAKNEVYKLHFERKDKWEDAMKEVINDPKTLYFTSPSNQIGKTPSDKVLGAQTFALNMDAAAYGMGGFGLQKDSEFLQIFNHYILKAMESGCLKRIFRNYHIDLYTKENFEMIEAQPLGYENTLFCGICLAGGACASILIVMIECIVKKMT